MLKMAVLRKRLLDREREDQDKRIHRYLKTALRNRLEIMRIRFRYIYG
jgi:hypothetical protein